MDSAERKVTAFLQQVNTIHNRKVPPQLLVISRLRLIFCAGGDAQTAKRKSPSGAHEKNCYLSAWP